MSAARTPVIVGSVAGLPTSAHGAKHLVWWGNIGFMVIEGTGFALAVAAYLYLKTQGAAWPPAGDRPPDLLWGALFTGGLLASQLPNLWVRRKALAGDERAVRWGSLLMTLLGAILLIPRGFEFAHLNVPWHRDAYGSALWMLLLLHTTHIATDWFDTAVQAAWLHTHEVGPDQFADVEDNSNYWTFVVLTWLPLYAVLYWLPRLG